MILYAHECTTLDCGLEFFTKEPFKAPASCPRCENLNLNHPGTWTILILHVD